MSFRSHVAAMSRNKIRVTNTKYGEFVLIQKETDGLKGYT
jgi:hypothetical protein